MIDRATFFHAVRQTVFGGRLSQTEVNGLSMLLDVWEISYAHLDYRWLAYALATAYHETAHTMQPIHERGKRNYFDKYEPNTRIGKRLGNTHKGDGYRFRGRGYVQLTGRRNYRLAGEKLGIDLIANPDLALQRDVAARILFQGMIDGWFTGRRLEHYIKPGGKANYVQARRVVNGLDRANLIAGYARKFARALRKAGQQSHKAQAQTPRKKPITKSTSIGNALAGGASAVASVAAAFQGLDWRVAAIIAGAALVAIGVFVWMRLRRGDLEFRV